MQIADLRLRPAALFLVAGLALSLSSCRSGRARPESYSAPSDPLVGERLETWRDWKLGLILHWGPYSQRGLVESWSICSEDEPWCRRDLDDYVEYKRRYEALPRTFDPKRFNPTKWAEAAKDAGMRYVVFTTKHHDGFCMWDTKETTYRITGPDCAFHKDPRADVTKGVFDAFRKEGLGIGAYFSKPDWHSPLYWWPRFATPTRHVNYDPKKYPERWQAFRDYSKRQILELVNSYGPIDILWLDGAWVRPRAHTPEKYAPWALFKDYDQDLDMASIASAARAVQPGLLIVDRWVAGPYEDYLTPEQKVPSEVRDEPWESCVTMGQSWSYSPKDKMKSTRQLLELLVGVVSKGGNLLLGLGVDGNGELPKDAYVRMKEMGEWLRIAGPAIYGSRPAKKAEELGFYHTIGKDGTHYAIRFLEEGKEELPEELVIPACTQLKHAKLHMLGFAGELEHYKRGCAYVVRIPPSVRKKLPTRHAVVFSARGD